jgi:hypothetical protein
MSQEEDDYGDPEPPRKRLTDREFALYQQYVILIALLAGTVALLLWRYWR